MNENDTKYIRCLSCKCLRNEKNDFEIYKGVKRKTCTYCKANRVRYKCIHKKGKSKCIECGGSSICIHKKYKPDCKECNGSSFCIHNRQKTSCKECGGSGVCIHNKYKTTCDECGGSQLCIHNKRKAFCKDCGGSQFCFHNKRKNICKDCGGSQICIHGKRRIICKECSPNLVVVNLVRKQVYRTFQNSNLHKINHSIEYLGCDTKTLKEHFKKKMTDEMTFENIHIDHIKPVSKFNLDDEEDILKCCHFTNLQPLLVKDNLELNNKWTDENELFWNENVIYKPDFHKIYKL